MSSKFIFTSVLFFVMTAQAHKALADIRFPDEELSREAVMPVFDEKIAIKNRRVNHAQRFELNLFGSSVLSEPIYNPYNFGVSLTYHFDNTRAIHIMGSFFADGLSGAGKELQAGIDNEEPPGTQNHFDASRAPHKEMMLAAHYQHSAYYGKISITKNSTMNMSLYGLVGGGVYMMSGEMAPMVNIGIGQRLYFTPHIALRLDVLLSAYNGFDITSTHGGADRLDNDTPQPEVDPSKFDKTLLFDTQIALGISFLI